MASTIFASSVFCPLPSTSTKFALYPVSYSSTSHSKIASTIFASSVFCPLPSTSTKFALYPVSYSSTSHSKIASFQLSTWPKSVFSPWNGLKHLDISFRPKSPNTGRKRRYKLRVVYASLFGVGAPEVLVIGVVALLVFGPKGLAEVARNLGKTLRAFQPTIRELQEVSRDFKSTLEREIGLDEISSSTQNTYSSSRPNSTPSPTSTISTDKSQSTIDPNGTLTPDRAYTSEDFLQITKEQLKASMEQPEDDQPNPQIQPQAKETATTVPPPQKPESET